MESEPLGATQIITLSFQVVALIFQIGALYYIIKKNKETREIL